MPAYTRDDYLTTTKPFEYLYAHKENKFEMKQLLGRMSAQAQTVGIRNLAALFKAYMETVSGTVTPGYNKTDFSGQEMELDCGVVSLGHRHLRHRQNGLRGGGLLSPHHAGSASCEH